MIDIYNDVTNFPHRLLLTNIQVFAYYSLAKIKLSKTQLHRIALRKKCPYSELFWSAFLPHFPAFGLNTERYGVSLRI